MSNTNCCIVNCSNTYKNCPPGTKFFCFSRRPCLQDQREKWIRSVRRINADGTQWQPARWSRICSAHFVGGQLSTDPSSPSYAPTIFPPSYRRWSTVFQDRASRYQRWRTRGCDEGVDSPHSSTTANEGQQQDGPPDEDMEFDECATDVYRTEEVSTQTDESGSGVTASGVFLSCLLNSTYCEASVQCNHLPVPQKETRERGTETINVDQLQPRGFRGYESVMPETDGGEVLKDLTGTSAACFAVLLGLFTQSRTPRMTDISLESRLLLFLMKMKHALTFAALGALFGVHRTTASRTFYSILDTLYAKTQGWLMWFPRDVVQETMPALLLRKVSNVQGDH
ncbi:uncharacterized protein LOC135387167 [Ornithodoros turicata]|uniref:uncharacterized protein LOC135387167 n=1 Tax=Ornithodoros turicata TaxID=34597 RepID=UPI003139ABA4